MHHATPLQHSAMRAEFSEVRTGARLRAEYVLPLRWDDDTELDELTRYLDRLTAWMDVTVVDGSDPDAVATHRHCWSELMRSRRLRVVPPRGAPSRNGKVAGVVTAVGLARHEHRLTGGMPYRGTRIITAAHSVRRLRRSRSSKPEGAHS